MIIFRVNYRPASYWPRRTPPKIKQRTAETHGEEKIIHLLPAISNSLGKMGSRIYLLLLVTMIVGFILADCRSLTASEYVAGDKTSSESTISLTLKQNQQFCQLCEQFATEALFYLKENQTQVEIIGTLHQACSKVYSFKEECTKLVDYYAPLFFTKIASFTPEEFCISVNLCNDVTLIRLPTRDDACALCHEVVDEILTGLEDPDIELKIIEVLLRGCNNAENFVQQCKKLIIQEGPLIIEHIKKFLTRRDFCNSIHVCGTRKVYARAKALSAA